MLPRWRGVILHPQEGMNSVPGHHCGSVGTAEILESRGMRGAAAASPGHVTALAGQGSAGWNRAWEGKGKDFLPWAGIF